MSNYEKLSRYSQFQSKYEMNESLTAHRQTHCYELNETDQEVLNYVGRYACRYPGVAYLKVSTLMKLVGKSESTVKRSIRKLEKLSILKRISTIREKAGGFGANILQIQRSDRSKLNGRGEVEKPSSASFQKENGVSKPFYNSNQSINTIKSSTNDTHFYYKLKALFNAHATKGDIPFSHFVKCLYGSIKKHNPSMPIFLQQQIMFESLAIALNKNANNPVAMLSAILQNKLKDAGVKMSKECIPDWFREYKLEQESTVPPAQQPVLNFEEEREKILAKLQACHES